MPFLEPLVPEFQSSLVAFDFVERPKRFLLGNLNQCFHLKAFA
jgi:hypothetical protein